MTAQVETYRAYKNKTWKNAQVVSLNYEELFSKCRAPGDHVLYNAMQIPCPCNCMQVKYSNKSIYPYKGKSIPPFCITNIGSSTEKVVEGIVEKVRSEIKNLIDCGRTHTGFPQERIMVVFKPLIVKKYYKKMRGTIMVGMGIIGE